MRALSSPPVAAMRVIILLAILGAALAAPKKPARIVGGDITSVNEYPYMSNMQYNWWGSWYQWCGGSLITANAVLSAAHCYYQDPASSWRVRLGTSYASSGGTVISASELVLHPQYDDWYLDNDIAIIRLASVAVLSPTIATVPIAGTTYNLADNEPVYAIGWGSLWSGGPYPEDLYHVQINVINQELCAERYAYLKTLPGYSGWPDITDGMLCAGILDVGGKDACQGDSGGPLSHRVAGQSDVLVGLTSWGFGCAHETYPGVNARVSHFTDWIVNNA